MHALEVSVYDIEVVDVVASEKEREPYVPVSLPSCSKHYHIMHVCSLLKEHCACEGGAESCHL